VIAGGGPMRRLATAGVLGALIGDWVTHTAEYARLDGAAGIGRELSGSVHLYMLPAAALLTLAAALWAARLWRAWTALGWRLEATRAGIAAAWRGRRHPHSLPADRALPPAGCRLLALWLPLVVVQVTLYLLQENLEARWAGLPMPGLGALTGVHWAAPLIHLAVALLIAAAACVLLTRFRRRARVIVIAQRLLHALVAAIATGTTPSYAGGGWASSPVDLFGPHILRRPPPSRAAS
jgi:hypothetical protein